MRAQLVLFILGAFASTCVAQETTCASDDGDECALLQASKSVSDESTSLLQNKVDTTKDEESIDQEDLVAVKESKDVTKPKEDSEGWPDIFKKVKAALGGGEALMKDFDGVKKAAGNFTHEIHAHVKGLTTAPPKGLTAIRTKVEAFFMECHDSANKLYAALKKVMESWVNGLGKVAPAGLQKVMNDLLAKVSEHGKHFTEAFKTASDDIKKITNVTTICTKVKHTLHVVLKKAADLAKTATALSTHGLSPDIKAAKDLLPEALKKEVEKVLAKANGAADRMLHKLTEGMKEITHGVAKVFGDHCTGLPRSGAGRLEVGIVAMVLSMLSFAM